MTTHNCPLVSIVSVTYNRRQDVLELLTALREQDYAPLEVIVVDNASEDGTADQIAEHFPEVTLVRNQQNTGMVAYNTGIEMAKGQYILFIDDDGMPATIDWVQRMVACLQENPKLGAIACQVRLTETGEVAPDDPQYLLVEDEFGGYPCPAFVCTGAGIRADAVRTVGSFPPFFFRSYMEFTLSTKLWNSGWQVRYFPDITVFHKKSLRAYKHSRAHLYWGLRNYYWYVWMFYPWPAVLEETAHHFIHTLKSAFQGDITCGEWGRAFIDAILGVRMTLRCRQPISRSTLGWLHRLRNHRRPPFFSEVRWARNVYEFTS